MGLTREETEKRRAAINKFLTDTWGPPTESPYLCGFPDCPNRRKSRKRKLKFGKSRNKHRFCDGHYKQMSRGGIESLRPIGSLTPVQLRAINNLSDRGYPIRDDLGPGKCCVEWCVRPTATPNGILCERHAHKNVAGEKRLRHLERLEALGVRLNHQFLGEICAIEGCGAHLKSGRMTFCEEHYSEYGPKARIFSRKETRPTDGGERVGH